MAQLRARGITQPNRIRSDHIDWDIARPDGGSLQAYPEHSFKNKEGREDILFLFYLPNSDNIIFLMNSDNLIFIKPDQIYPQKEEWLAFLVTYLIGVPNK